MVSFSNTFKFDWMLVLLMGRTPVMWTRSKKEETPLALKRLHLKPLMSDGVDPLDGKFRILLKVFCLQEIKMFFLTLT